MDDLYDKSGKNGKSLFQKFKLFFKGRIIEKNRDFFRNPIIFWLLLASILFNLANWIVLALFIKPVDKTIILHYNVYFGVDSVGHWAQAYFLPAIGLILLIVNLILAGYFYLRKDRMASHILMITALMVQLNLLIASASIILINY